MSDREVIFNQEKVDYLKVKLGEWYGDTDKEILHTLMSVIKVDYNLSDLEFKLLTGELNRLCNK